MRYGNVLACRKGKTQREAVVVPRGGVAGGES